MGIKIALAGNPNSGKTTLFNALTGANQYVGNWPGVTVEKKEGKIKKHTDVTLTDLPGIYSLSPYTLEEVVARNYLIGERPDAILNIVDGTNLERNLYLTTQLTELGIPVVIAINMIDVVKKNQDAIDTQKLGEKMGCKVVEISALKGTGIAEAASAAIDAAKNGKSTPKHEFAESVENALNAIAEKALHSVAENQRRWYAVKLFERDEKALEQLKLSPEVLSGVESIIADVEKELDDDSESIITNERYVYITTVIKDCYVKKSAGKLTLSDKIDKVLTNRWAALPIFVVVMAMVYVLSMGSTPVSIGTMMTDFTNDVIFGEWIVPGVTNLLTGWGMADWLVSLIADGIFGGVGAVLGFVPQMIVLFILLALLEDCGYMARVAFIMDRIFRKFGLSGKSFIPMLVATGCGVPGIMASRTIEQDRDRKMTIMTTGFIPCGAKMPIVGLIAGALFGGSALIAVSTYFIGVAAVIISGIMLKKTKPFAGDPAPFVMELPSYHAPVAGNVFRATWERAWSFIKRAGTVILASSIVIWILNSLSFEGGFHYITEEIGGKSILNVIGEGLAWIFMPLGFGQWQAAVATVLGLVAKEEVVGVFGTLANMDPDVIMELAEAGAQADELVAIGNVFFEGSKLAGMSFLIFNLLCAPCFAAMGAIKREMHNWKWSVGAIGYMCVLAYVVSLIVYQIGAWFIGKGNIVGTIFAVLFLAFMIYMLVRPNKYKEDKLEIQ